MRIAPEPFAKGNLRAAHLMLLLGDDGEELACVAKRGILEDDQVQQAYEEDVIMQSCCQAIATAFNACKPTKEVRRARGSRRPCAVAGRRTCGRARILRGTCDAVVARACVCACGRLDACCCGTLVARTCVCARVSVAA